MLVENQLFGNNWLHVEMSKINLLNITFKVENITNSLMRYSIGSHYCLYQWILSHLWGIIFQLVIGNLINSEYRPEECFSDCIFKVFIPHFFCTQMFIFCNFV